MLDRLGKIGYRLIRVAMLDPFPDTVIQVPFQNDLADLVQSAFCGVDLHQNIFARNVLVDHLIDRVDLAYDFIEPPVQIFGIHTLPHHYLPSRYLYRYV